MTAVIYFGLLFLFIGHFGILSIGIASLVTSGIAGIFFLPISIKRYRMTREHRRSTERTESAAVPGA